MKIVAAVVAPSEVEPLITAGADELYCGVAPDGLGELAALVETAGAHQVPVAVVLDERAVDAAAVVDLAARLAAAGARALMVSDAALVAALRRAGAPLELHRSSAAGGRPADPALLAEPGVRRVVLPRPLSLGRIAELCATGTPVEWAVVVVNDGGGLEERPGDEPAGDPRQLDWRAGARRRPAPARLDREWEASWSACRRRLAHLRGALRAESRGGFPGGPCGVCALPALAAAGVGSVVVPGRGLGPAARLGGVRLVRAVLNWIERGDRPELVAANARLLRDAPAACADGSGCIFPDLPPPPAAVAGETVAPLDPDDPDVRRLRRVAAALSGEGLDLRWAGAGFELAFPDEGQPDRVSRVTLAKVGGSVRCYARSGNLGLWHAGHLETPRLAQAIRGIMRLLELMPD